MSRTSSAAVVFVLGLFVVAATEDSRHVVFRVLFSVPYYLPSLSDTSASGKVAPAFAVLTSEAEERAFLATYARRVFADDPDSVVLPAPIRQIDYATETGIVIVYGTATMSSPWLCLDSVVQDSTCVAFATAVSPQSVINDNSFGNPVLVAALQGSKRTVTLAPLSFVTEKP